MTREEALLWLRQHGAAARKEGGQIVLDVPQGVRVPIGLTTALREVSEDILALAVANNVSDGPVSEEAKKQWVPKITMLADVQPEHVRWLWHGYIPLGKLTVLDGDPGNGKSTVTCDLAARVSGGRGMPDGSMSDLDGPAGVVLMSAEDGPADTIRPRLDAAGADVRRIALLECAVNGERERGITLADLYHIEAAIARVDARLVIIDPLMAYLGSDTNSYRDQDVRGVLAPLARLADRTGTAIIVIRHFSKGQSANVLYRGGGSIGIIGAVRVGLVVAPDPDEPDGPRRVLAVAKSNLAAKPPALAYRLTEAENGVARIVWEGATQHTAAAITVTMQPQDEGERAEGDEVAGALKDALAKGRRLQKEVMREVRETTGASESTVHRARRSLGITSVREGFGPGSQVYWQVPTPASKPEPAPYMPHTVHTRRPPEDEKYGNYVAGMADAPDSDNETEPPIPDWIAALPDKDAADG